MSRLGLVTAVTDDEPLKWGLDFSRVAVPMIVHCTPAMAETIRAAGTSADVLLVEAAPPHEMALRDKLTYLSVACGADPVCADRYYWVDVGLLYRHLSFAFLYSDLLRRALHRYAGDLAFFSMPGYRASSFFGGPAGALHALLSRLDGDPPDLFEPMPPADGAAPFRAAFSANGCRDLNLELADSITEPFVHVIGDSHVLNCLTLNRAIGCRPNVLMATGDVSPIAVPYTHHFSHHLGGRTMHHAGEPGALLAEAAHCGVKAGDAVVWVFGEIDARCHIVKQHREQRRPLGEVIDTLAQNYVRAIREVAVRYDRSRHVVFAPIPPLDNPRYESDDLPIVGTIEERVAVTRQLRAVLATLCDRHGIALLSLPEEFETARGDLRWELSDHFCHISSTFQEPILTRLYRLLAGGAGGAATLSPPLCG